MNHPNNRKPPKQPAVAPKVQINSQRNLLRQQRFDQKIQQMNIHKQYIHHGPIMNTRKPHIPHG